MRFASSAIALLVASVLASPAEWGASAFVLPRSFAASAQQSATRLNYMDPYSDASKNEQLRKFEERRSKLQELGVQAAKKQQSSNPYMSMDGPDPAWNDGEQQGSAGAAGASAGEAAAPEAHSGPPPRPGGFGTTRESFPEGGAGGGQSVATSAPSSSAQASTGADIHVGAESYSAPPSPSSATSAGDQSPGERARVYERRMNDLSGLEARFANEFQRRTSAEDARMNGEGTGKDWGEPWRPSGGYTGGVEGGVGGGMGQEAAMGGGAPMGAGMGGDWRSDMDSRSVNPRAAAGVGMHMMDPRFAVEEEGRYAEGARFGDEAARWAGMEQEVNRQIERDEMAREEEFRFRAPVPPLGRMGGGMPPPPGGRHMMPMPDAPGPAGMMGGGRMGGRSPPPPMGGGGFGPDDRMMQGGPRGEPWGGGPGGPPFDEGMGMDRGGMGEGMEPFMRPGGPY
uniref:Uncharacterized protein n=1 Tax=Odontella aurita TaxID=265563 RepID=A0A7S4MGV3_9STRA|mmetsp:Transcript_21186/g.61620  ORF Transcript_21186/g.61620 Transcript_21186/m.61620 type:complete len:454 (+) Transcript_21186:155-1516(+)